ncbi:MAG TPA: hypothetical protein VHX60_03770 [Acidobacteriaceae bacterium]|jgi:hypothetical protein|nr:hypothetical protein [Acidobacteriaceae bacterium]
MKTINLILWAVGLALQVGLLVVLYRRGLMRRFPIFTLLITLYVLRSATLYALSGHIDRDTMTALYDFLSMADVALQLGVAAEIALSLVRGRGEWSGVRTLKIVGVLVAWIAAAAAGVALLPAHSRVPLDRGLAFSSFVMLLLWLWMLVFGQGGAARKIAGGFAIYGAVAVAANLERGYAATHRSAREFVAGSYAPSAVYLGVLVVWLLTLRAAAAAQAGRKRARGRAAG